MANGLNLLSGGIFSQPTDRGQRRLGLMQEAMGAFGGTPQRNLGAGLGLLIGRGIGGALGGVDPQQERQGKIQQVQNQIAQEGLDPVNTPNDFFNRASELFQAQGLPDLAQKTRLQQLQLTGEKKAQKGAFTVTGGTPQAQAVARRFGIQVPEGETFEIQTENGRPIDINRLGASSQISNILPGEVQGLSKPQEKFVEDVSAQARVATQTLPSLAALTDLVTQEDIPQGSLQPLVTSLQGVAADLGIDTQAIADRIGVNLGDLGGKQEFDRLAKELVIQSFEKFKGNLNSKEVALAEDSQGGLGKSREGNMRAFAAIRAASEIAQDYGRKVLFAEGPIELRKVVEERQERGTERFKELQEKYLNEMRQAAGTGGGQGITVNDIQSFGETELRDWSQRTDELSEAQLRALGERWDKVIGQKEK